MRDEDQGFLEAAPDVQQFLPHHDLGLRIERAERFVHQIDVRRVRQNAAQRDTLAHAAGQGARVVIGEAFQPGEFEQLIDARGALILRIVAAFEADFDVLAHRRPRQQGVALEHEADAGGRAVDAFAAYADFAGRWTFQARNQLQ